MASGLCQFRHRGGAVPEAVDHAASAVIRQSLEHPVECQGFFKHAGVPAGTWVGSFSLIGVEVEVGHRLLEHTGEGRTSEQSLVILLQPDVLFAERDQCFGVRTVPELRRNPPSSARRRRSRVFA